MAEPATRTEAVREGVREVRQTPRRIGERVEGVVEDNALVRHMLDLRVVAYAVATAVVLALLALLLSPKLAALVLVLAFAGAWLGFAHRRYNQRRPTTSGD